MSDSYEVGGVGGGEKYSRTSRVWGYAPDFGDILEGAWVGRFGDELLAESFKPTFLGR